MMRLTCWMARWTGAALSRDRCRAISACKPTSYQRDAPSPVVSLTLISDVAAAEH